jgi:hypothetical protein
MRSMFLPVFLSVVFSWNSVYAEGATFYVSPDGSDNWSGTLPARNEAGTDGPLATIEAARDVVRKIKNDTGLPEGGVCVTVMPGVYSLKHPLQLTDQDSGTQEKPVVYRAEGNGAAIISGGVFVDHFVPVTDAAILGRLDPEAREHVQQKVLDIGDFGSPAGGGIELFFRGAPMTLARWPNEGFVQIKDIVVDDGHKIHGHKGSETGLFVYEEDRPERWTQENDGWLHGYWFWDWSDERQKIASVDLNKKQIQLVEPYHTYGYRKRQWYYAYNMLAELDTPGEWYIDREAGILYFWPPDEIHSGDVIISVLSNLVTLEKSENLTLHGFVFEASRELAVAVRESDNVRIAGCTVRNCGGDAVGISGGSDNTVFGCEIHNMGGGGISLAGGNRETLEPGGHLAENNHIHHYGRWYRMYRKGVSLGGVGNRAAHNLIHHAPHIGIGFSGNDHCIEYNEIHHVCLESNDAGAMYAGRNWTMRGNVIRFNYLWEITGFQDKGCVGVYLDDMFSSADIIGNIFYKVTRAAFIGGGRDCSVVNNIFVDCTPALHVDARALGWAHYHADEWIEEAHAKGTLSGIRYKELPYSERYPQLPGIIEDEPKAPKGNVITRNICVGGTWDGMQKEAKPYLTIENNLIEGDPLFIDRENHDFRLQADSPAFDLGFEQIPVEKIGCYDHPECAKRFNIAGSNP